MKQCTNCKITKLYSEFYKMTRVKKDGSQGYRSYCKVCISEKTKARRKVDSERMKEVARKSYEKCKYRYKERERKYYQDNKEAYKARHEKYMKDPMYRMKESIRARIRSSLKAVGKNKYRSTLEFLKCDWIALKNYLDSTFEANYGMPREYIESFDLHIDHIIPIKSARTKEELEKLNHYSNLQYLTAEDNLSKAAKLDWSI